MMAWVTDSPNPLTHRNLPLSYRFHVAMCGSLGIGGDLTKWGEDEMAEARELVSLYKQIRPVVQQGSLYRLASVRHDDVGAFEFIGCDEREVVVVAWTGPRRFGPRPSRLRLRALRRDALYRDLGTGERLAGGALLELGIALPEGLGFASGVTRLVLDDA
jgi:alpha-galactosidase